jgi:hypothetical protein
MMRLKMINLMDKFFISIGLEAPEIMARPHRGYLYIGMLYSLGLASAFGTMAIITI